MDAGIVVKLLAAAGLFGSTFLLLRLILGPERWRAWRRWWRAAQQFGSRRQQAREEAARVIDRARRKPEVRERGNVIHPRAWDDDSRPPPMH